MYLNSTLNSLRAHTGNITDASIGPPLLVMPIAKQSARPKRIGALALPLASFGGPIKRGVSYLPDQLFFLESILANLKKERWGTQAR